MELNRTDTSKLSRWWWTIDRPMMVALLTLIVVGAVMCVAASPSVAVRLHYERFYFVERQLPFLFLSILVMFGISLMDEVQVRRFAVLGFMGSMLLLMLLPFIGFENKGAIRWMHIAGMSIQPSEFMKPFFAVVMGWIFAEGIKSARFPSYRLAIVVFTMVAGLLLVQPDVGMTITVTCMWIAQFFMAGLPFIFIIILAVLGLGGFVGAYFVFDHVKARIDRFLDPSSGDNYQVEKSLEAFHNGGLLGMGPGEGQVKRFLPDSHTDFVFAVTGEEYGALVCLLVIALFAYIVLRGFWRVSSREDMFTVLSVVGLLTQFGIQAVINMGVAVNMLPAKGMTLPFLSYGGSSAIAVAIGMGMVLALTRVRYGYKYND